MFGPENTQTKKGAQQQQNKASATTTTRTTKQSIDPHPSALAVMNCLATHYYLPLNLFICWEGACPYRYARPGRQNARKPKRAAPMQASPRSDPGDSTLFVKTDSTQRAVASVEYRPCSAHQKHFFRLHFSSSRFASIGITLSAHSLSCDDSEISTLFCLLMIALCTGGTSRPCCTMI